MRRFLIVAVMGFTLISSSAFAADDETATTLMTSAVAAATSLGQRLVVASPINRTAQFKASNRPMALPTLYAGSALLQGYDAYSTLSALKSGATEANPLMKGITKSPVAFISLKAGMTTAAILSAERMWKDDHRVKAVVVMLVSNGMMAAVAAHNASVLRQVQ